MASITATTGIYSGVPITETVEKLIAVAAKPRDNLKTRNTDLQKQQTAVTQLSALLMSVGYLTDNLGKDSLYNHQQASSSDSGTLSATVTGNPTVGTYQYTAVRVAQNQQLLSSGFRSASEPLGGGKISVRFGPDVEQAVDLGLLGNGSGFVRGKIRITDGSGASATIDLTAAQSVDDILQAINENTTINVSAEAHGDGFRLIDQSGASVSHLKVQEVNGGVTANSLGLDGIDTADATAQGRSVLRISQSTALDELNNGQGIKISTVLPDMEYTLRDGSIGVIDLSPILSGTSTVKKETTLGDVLEAINTAGAGKFFATIDTDGKRLRITDMTTGEGEFKITSLYDSRAAEDLGLTGTSVGGVITGERIVSGTKTVLLSRLNGGKGLGPLGTLQLTDRAGQSAGVDLSAARTLEEVIDAINASGVGIRAQVNAARNGLELTDTTGAVGRNMTVANGDGTNTADALHIAVDSPATSVNSGDLHQQILSYNTRLSSLNGGAGVATGSFTIIDSTNHSAILDFASVKPETIGDVIAAINRLPLRVSADVNETGDGILIRDLDRSTGKLRVIEGASTTAADLGLTAAATTVTINGNATQVVNGSMTRTVTLDVNDTLTGLAGKLNALGAGFQASVFNDGSSRPFRLVLNSQRGGTAGELRVDLSQANFSVSMQETVAGQNALLAVGNSANAASSLLISSTNNRFTNALPGVTLEIKQASTRPTTITVGDDSTDFVATMKALVENYNSFREYYDSYTTYDADTNTPSVMSGDPMMARLENDVSSLFTKRYLGVGSVQSLAELGLSMGDGGMLSLDEDKLRARYAQDPAAVKKFFTDPTNGVSAKMHTVMESLYGRDVSMLAQRFQTLKSKMERNQQKIEFLNQQLEKQRSTLLTQFYNMDIAIGKLQNSLSAIEDIAYISRDGTKSK